MLQFLNDDTGILTDAVFCFTGKSTKTRIAMRNIAMDAGGCVTQSITKQTTILVVADPNSASSKIEKAQQFGLEMISPEQFFTMCSCITKSNGGNPISQLHIRSPEPFNTPTGKRKHSSVRHIQL